MSDPIEFVMPSLGADMDEGTITEWMVGPGDAVERGDIVAIVETDKADIDIEVWHSGRVAEILVPPGRLVPVGTPLAMLDVTDGEAIPPAPVAAAAPAEATAPATTSPPSPPPAPPPPAPPPPAPPPSAPDMVAITSPPTRHGPTSYGAGDSPDTGDDGAAPASRIAASPLARRLAGERGIDLSTLSGSGPDGAITAQDLAAVSARPRPVQPEPDRPKRDPAERMRRAIADLMARSKREIPHYYLAADIDLEAASIWLEAANAERPVKDRILPAAVLLKAVALAAAEHPNFNGFWLDGRFQPGDGVHLGVAVSLRGGGLVAPALHDADQLSIPDLMVGLRDVVARARSGRLRGSEMSDPTLTVSNLGDRGVEVVNGVIYPPQVSLVGLGRISTRPAVVDGEIVARRLVTATLAADHRATDGQLGARFLNTIAKLVQEPEKL